MALKKKGHVIVFARNASCLRVSFKNLGDDFVLSKLKCNFLPRFTGYFLRSQSYLILISSVVVQKSCKNISWQLLCIPHRKPIKKLSSSSFKCSTSSHIKAF